MGQKLDLFKGNNFLNNNIFKDFICNECNTFLLLEWIQTKEEILIRSHCFCGTLTTNINDEIKYLLRNFNFYQGIRCHQILQFGEYKNPNIKKYCIKCKNFYVMNAH